MNAPRTPGSTDRTMPDWLHYDEGADTLTIRGIKYTGELLRDFAHAMPCGQPFEIVQRDGGTLAVRRLFTVSAARSVPSNDDTELRKALRALLDSDPNITGATDDDLRLAMRDVKSEAIVKVQAAAVLQARVALATKASSNEHERPTTEDEIFLAWVKKHRWSWIRDWHRRANPAVGQAKSVQPIPTVVLPTT